MLKVERAGVNPKNNLYFTPHNGTYVFSLPYLPTGSKNTDEGIRLVRFRKISGLSGLQTVFDQCLSFCNLGFKIMIQDPSGLPFVLV